MLKEEPALGEWLSFLPLPISRGNCGRWKTKSRHLQLHGAPREHVLFDISGLAQGSPSCSVPMPAYLFSWKWSRVGQELLIQEPRKCQYHTQTQHGWGRSRARSDIGGAGYCSCCASPGGNFTWGDTMETKVNDSPWHRRHFQMLQAAKARTDGYCQFGQVAMPAAGCSWSAKWRSLSGQAWENLSLPLPKCRHPGTCLSWKVGAQPVSCFFAHCHFQL